METKSVDELLNLLKDERDIFRKARIVHQLRIDKEISLNTIGGFLHKHPSYISHLIRLLRIPQLAVDGYYSGQISATHLMILSRLQTEKQMVEAYEEILKKDLTAPQTEMYIRQLKFDVNTDNEMLDSKAIEEIANRLQEKHEARVRVIQSRVRGKIVIEKRGNSQETSVFIKKMDKLLSHTFVKGEEIEVLE